MYHYHDYHSFHEKLPDVKRQYKQQESKNNAKKKQVNKQEN